MSYAGHTGHSILWVKSNHTCTGRWTHPPVCLMWDKIVVIRFFVVRDWQWDWLRQCSQVRSHHHQFSSTGHSLNPRHIGPLSHMSPLLHRHNRREWHHHHHTLWTPYVVTLLSKWSKLLSLSNDHYEKDELSSAFLPLPVTTPYVNWSLLELAHHRWIAR